MLIFSLSIFNSNFPNISKEVVSVLNWITFKLAPIKFANCSTIKVFPVPISPVNNIGLSARSPIIIFIMASF